jgi:hypothetical protein
MSALITVADSGTGSIAIIITTLAAMNARSKLNTIDAAKQLTIRSVAQSLQRRIVSNEKRISTALAGKT